MSSPPADDLIRALALEPLPDEGGFYRQIFRSSETIPNASLGSGYPAEGERPLGTLIHYLLTVDGFSAMHRLPTAEIWIWQLGDPAEMLLLPTEGQPTQRILGPDLVAGQTLQLTVPAHAWQGTRLLPGSTHHGYTLVSCMMSPGFAWSDFEAGDADALSTRFPSFSAAIRARTRA